LHTNEGDEIAPLDALLARPHIKASTDLSPSRLRARQLALALSCLLGACGLSLIVGPADLSPGSVLAQAVSHLHIGVHSNMSAADVAIVWQIRAPRLVLGALVGAMLALAGASYQGVFQNPLADPYLLGIAAGAGLGATLAVEIVTNPSSWPIDPVPLAAFIGALIAVGATIALGRSTSAARSASTLVLSGVAVGAFFTAIQTFAQQRDAPTLERVYSWILGGLSGATWSQVELALPYVVVCAAVLLASRRLLDVLSVGDEEATSLGIRASRVRTLIVVAATLGTAAVVSVSGLVGFVGIIVPHTIRLALGPSYRRIVPLAFVYGAAFVVLADLCARTIAAPSEIPLGVITAFFGAPFFFVVLRQSRYLS
jgi:iron complex transport system permease protein